MLKRPIRIWNWDGTPQKYRDLSTHGGDEDFVIFVPQEIIDRGYDLAWDWIETKLLADGWSASEYEVSDGLVIIRAHG